MIFGLLPAAEDRATPGSDPSAQSLCPRPRGILPGAFALYMCETDTSSMGCQFFIALVLLSHKMLPNQTIYAFNRHYTLC